MSRTESVCYHFYIFPQKHFLHSLNFSPAVSKTTQAMFFFSLFDSNSYLECYEFRVLLRETQALDLITNYRKLIQKLYFSFFQNIEIDSNFRFLKCTVSEFINSNKIKISRKSQRKNIGCFRPSEHILYLKLFPPPKDGG